MQNGADPSDRTSKAWVCDVWLVEIAGSNPAQENRYLSAVGVVCLSGECRCDGPITRPEESYLGVELSVIVMPRQ
jgi:hypothetical protein